MQIHRPLQFTLPTRMLDIDLVPRISITTSTDNYTTNRAGKTLLLPVPVVVPPPAPASTGSAYVPAPVHHHHHHSSCAASHLSASFVTQPRSRSPSPSPRPVIVTPLPSSRVSVPPSTLPMAVLSRTPVVVRKSPSLVQMRGGVSPRSSSAERPTSAVMPVRRSPSPVPVLQVQSKSGSSGSLNKLTLPSPVVVRRHSTKSPMVSARSILSPPAVRKVQAATTSVHSHQTQAVALRSQAAVAPMRRKSPVIASRNRSFTVSTTSATAQAASGSGPQTPLEQQKFKYERNLKKFYTWCQHCRRVQRVPDFAKGPLTAGSTATAAAVTTGKSTPAAIRAARLSTPNVKQTVSRVPNSRASKTPLSKHSLFSFDSSDLPLSGSVPAQLVEMKERPKSARTASTTEPISIEKPKFQSLFDFDDALSLTPDRVDLNWMVDPLDSDDDFYCYDLDVETMSVCSDSSIVAMAITCDTKLKDDDELFIRAPLRKTYSSHQ